MATIPFPTPPVSAFSYTFRKQLDGIGYRFEYRWNTRDKSWYLDVGDDTGAATIRNVRMLIGDDLWAPFRALGGESCPQGTLNVVDTIGTGVDTGDRLLLGDTIQVEYVEVAT